MKRLFVWLAGMIAIALLGGCNSGGDSADPPASVLAEARENAALVTFPMQGGVEYWLFYAPSSSLTSTNFNTVAGGKVITGSLSPQLVTGLTNGITYYFTVNGRTDGGPGGPGTPLVSATPRLAGAAWSVGTPIASGDLRGTAFGTVFAAVGSNGAIFSSADGITWTARNFVVGTDLNAANFGNNLYLAVGARGVLLVSSDAATWTQQAIGTASDLYGIVTNGSGTYVAVGANGTIVSSVAGGAWTVVDSGTTSSLYGVTYANGSFVAVGAGGVALTSSDGATWVTVASQSALDLRAVAYNGTAATFVAVGVAGTLVTSPDGLTWTRQPPISTKTLNSVVSGGQFVATGGEGTILTSTDGLTWQTVASGTTSNLYATVYGDGHYAAVGASGTNLTAY